MIFSPSAPPQHPKPRSFSFLLLATKATTWTRKRFEANKMRLLRWEREVFHDTPLEITQKPPGMRSPVPAQIKNFKQKMFFLFFSLLFSHSRKQNITQKCAKMFNQSKQEWSNSSRDVTNWSTTRCFHVIFFDSVFYFARSRSARLIDHFSMPYN